MSCAGRDAEKLCRTAPFGRPAGVRGQHSTRPSTPRTLRLGGIWQFVCLTRFPDLVMANPEGKTVAIQVGRATKGGLPVARERRALQDLRNSAQFDHVFFLRY